MKKKIYRLIMAAALPALIQTASADVLLMDTFHVAPHADDSNLYLNQELAGRQTGTLAPTTYKGVHIHHQVGNTGTDVGQPGGAPNGDFVLLAFDGAFCSDVDVAAVATGPLTIEFDMYLHGANNPSTDPTTWVAFSLRNPPGDNMSPVAGAGQFGFLVRANGGVQVFQNGGEIAGTWDVPGFASADHWTLTFSDPAGTGSAFNGNGSQVTVMNGATTLGTLGLGQLNSAGLRAGFRNLGNRFGGISNLKFSGTPAVLTPPGRNLSFEYDRIMPGTSWNYVPTSWTGFNLPGGDRIGSQYPSGGDFSVMTPLAAPADGNQFCWINAFDGNGTVGMYQNMGALQPNGIYTLTVAIGSRADRINSPGIISLVNGTDNAGTLMATGGGLPITQDTWEDYTVTFATGASVSGDLTIVLSALGAGTIQADFDNVRLAFEPSVIPLPILMTNTTPASATVPLGSNVVFTAAYSNSPSVTLQWQKIIAGPVTNNINTGVVTATNNGIVTSTLTLNNAQLADSGSYRLQAANATNPATVVYTASAPLTVIPTITWYPAGTYNGSFSDSSVLALAGSVANQEYGVGFGITGFGQQVTTDGYIFDDYSVGNMSILGSVTVFGGYFTGGSGDGALDILLADGVFGSAANTATLNNLTIGQAYTVMVLLADTRTTSAGSTFHVTDGITVSPEQQYAFANGTPKIGGFVMGTFTAAATTQPLTVVNSSGLLQFNAILLEKGIAPTPPIPPTLTTDIHPLLSVVTAGRPVTLSVAASGALPLHYQWSNQSGPISGATNSSYLFNAVAGTNFYHVVVTNSFGVVPSASAVVISSPAIVTVNNFSFEDGSTPAFGNGAIPVMWTSFNGDWAGLGTGPGFSAQDGEMYFAVNTGPGHNGASGIYQDVGPLLPNTTYTLTVAIGRSTAAGVPPHGVGDWSPGIISLLNGIDSTGTLLATTTGYPDTVGTWQDYSASFTTGPAATGNLVITLSDAPADTWQATFDNVRLSKVPIFQFGPPVILGGDLILTAVGGTPGAGFTLLTATNLSQPISWTTNSIGTLDDAGAFSNAVPIGTAPARFYWLRQP